MWIIIGLVVGAPMGYQLGASLLLLLALMEIVAIIMAFIIMDIKICIHIISSMTKLSHSKLLIHCRKSGQNFSSCDITILFIEIISFFPPFSDFFSANIYGPKCITISICIYIYNY
jgi:hypothetical protein